jgi:hypothetical protein
MIAFVEQPIAIATAMPFSKLARVRIDAGVSSSQTICTMRCPHCALMRMWFASAAGMADAPGSVMPIASAMPIIVAAVPIVMHVPWLRAIPASTSAHCASLSLPARRSSQYFHASAPDPSTLPFQLPRSIGPAGR